MERSGGLGDRPVILYVEDDPLEREATARLIGSRVGTVTTAASAAEALRLFETIKPDLVLSDICMPDEDGLSLARAIRAARPSVAVVLISAHSDNRYLYEALRIGVRDFLFKPVNVVDLVQVLERSLEESRLAKEYEHLRLHNLKPQEIDVMARLYRYFRPLADAAPLLIRVGDEAGNCTFFNQGWTLFAGCEQAALAGQEWLAFVHPEDRAVFLERSGWALKNRVPFEVEYRLRRHDGEYRWVLDHGMPRINGDLFEGFVNSCVDVSDVRRTKAVEQANARFQSLFQTMLTGFALHDAVCDEAGRMIDYRFLQVNPAFEKMTGKSAAELIGKRVLEVFPQTENHWIKRYERVTLRGERLEFEEYSRALDKYFVVSAFAPVAGQFAVMAQDVTERKRAQIALEAVNRDLEARVAREVEKRRNSELALMQQARASMLGEMLSALAHHWRQPLSAVALYIQGIGEAFHNGELSAAYLDRAVDRSTELIMQMSKTVDTARGFSADRPGEARRCALEEIKEVFSLAAPELEALGIAVRARCEAGGFKNLDACDCPKNFSRRAVFYPAEFRQALFNLITNARDAILQHRLEEPRPSGGEMIIGYESDGREERITLEDNGGGFKEGTIDHLFEPFFTTKDRGQGAGVISGVGLGLYLAKVAIEERMKGSLRAENTPQGAKITIVLPLRDSAGGR